MRRRNKALILALSFSLGGCAGYRFGAPERSFPGDYHQISVPVFNNLSQEVGVEVAVTNAMIREIERAKVGRITSKEKAEVELVGTIQSLTDVPNDATQLPQLRGAVLSSVRSVTMSVRLALFRLSDKVCIWQSDFSGVRTYVSSNVTRPVINTVNPLYDLSARRSTVEQIAGDMMAEAHDRLTENF